MKQLGVYGLTFVALLLLRLPVSADPILAGPGFQESGYTLVYALSPPNHSDFDGGSGVPYQVNIASSIANGSFSRIGYYVEYEIGSGPVEWVSVSMNAFTNNASLIGVPTLASGALFNDVAVTDMDISSDVAGVTTGNDLSNGFVQFWPNCYTNSVGHYATGDDQPNSDDNCYGSMQIGDGVGNTVFAYNSWNNPSDGDLGIGNDPSSSNTDWTFANNIQDMSVKEIEVFVDDQVSSVPEPATLGLVGSALIGMYLRRRRPGEVRREEA